MKYIIAHFLKVMAGQIGRLSINGSLLCASFCSSLFYHLRQQVHLVESHSSIGEGKCQLKENSMSKRRGLHLGSGPILHISIGRLIESAKPCPVKLPYATGITVTQMTR